jgi:membrane protein YdbS with pleckstrin-like domain
MGYVEKIMGDNEQAVYHTHLHWIVLLQRVGGWLFAFLVFLGLGLAVFFLKDDRDRFVIGVIALGSVVLPLYVIGIGWVRGRRGREFLELLWRPALAAVLILAVAAMIMVRPQTRPIGWLLVALAVVPLAEVVRVVLDWVNERYIITNRRVMEVTGIINKHVRDSALEKVNDVDMKQSVVGRVLGYGTVQIITGSDIGINLFHRISNPVRFKRAMLNAKEQLHTTDLPLPAKPAPAGVLAVDAEAAVPEGSPSAEGHIPDLIEELADLYRRGILSDEEFQAKKKELLARL